MKIWRKTGDFGSNANWTFAAHICSFTDIFSGFCSSLFFLFKVRNKQAKLSFFSCKRIKFWDSLHPLHFHSGKMASKKKQNIQIHIQVFLTFLPPIFPCSILEISQINFNPTNLCSPLKCVRSRWKQCQVSKHEQDEKHELCRESEKWPVFIRRGLRRSVDARGDLVHFVYSKLYITSRSPQRRRCSSSIFPPLAPLSLLSFDLRFSSPQSHWQRRDVRLQEFTL